MKRPLVLLLLLSLTAAGCQSTPVYDPASITDGRDLIAAMHDRYARDWYRQLEVRQEVIYHDDMGLPARREEWTEYISLPGRVRSVIGDEADGNGELYVNGAFHIIESGRVTRTAEQAHPVLILGYDIYCQRPNVTEVQLQRAGFGLSQVRRSTWQDRPVFIVGAPEGDLASPQFWIDQERLLCLRIINRSPRGTLIDIQFTGYEPFAGVWLCTGLDFYRNGRLFIRERDLGHSIPEKIDPARFVPPANASP